MRVPAGAGTGWAHGANLKQENTQPGNQIGTSIAASGDGRILAIGSPVEQSNATGVDGDHGNQSLTAAGAAYLY